jgi:hypothetical protein
MSDHTQLNNGDVRLKRSDHGTARIVLLALVGAVVLVGFLFLMAFNEIRSRPAVHSIFFMVLLSGFIVASVVLDILLFERKRNQAAEDPEAKRPTYHPNLRIWAVGMIFGIGSTFVYLISVVTLSLVRVTAVTQGILYQYMLLFIVLTIAVAF